MSKYSSDSDSSDKHSSRKYYKNRDRSYSSDSSTSRSKRRKEKKYRRDRSRSIDSDKYSKSRKHKSGRYHHKSYRSSSRSLRSVTPEKSRQKDRSKYRRSRSKDRSSRRSRSGSRDAYGRSRKLKSEYKDKSPTNTSTSSSSSSSFDKSDYYKFKESKDTEFIGPKLLDDNAKLSTNVLDDLNSDNFVQKQFSSSTKTNVNKKMLDNIVIDLKSQTIKVPDVEITEPDSIFHPNLFANEEARMEKWIKELYAYRQKALNGESVNV